MRQPAGCVSLMHTSAVGVCRQPGVDSHYLRAVAGPEGGPSLTIKHAAPPAPTASLQRNAARRAGAAPARHDPLPRPDRPERAPSLECEPRQLTPTSSTATLTAPLLPSGWPHNRTRL